MTHQSNLTHATSDMPQSGFDPSLDSFVIDDEFDDFLDRHVFAIRESLADFRNA